MARKVVEKFNHGIGEWAGGYYKPHGGNHGGYLAYSDTDASDAEFSLNGSDKLLGDKSAYFHGILSYDIFASNVDTVPYGSIAISSDDGGYIFQDVKAPGTDWTHISVGLDAKAHWHFGRPDGPLATNDQIKAVLAYVNEIAIHTAFSSGPETDGLDNVAFTPSAAAIVPSHEPIGAGGFVQEELNLLHVGSIATHISIA